MGAGRTKKTFHLKEKPPPSWSVNSSVSARNLPKGELGGVIFGCKHNTIKECLSRELFGLPSKHFAYVRNIIPGLPLFLFNYSDRKLHGIFEAVSHGKLNINPYAWTNDNGEATSYGAQVRVHLRSRCLPLLEDQFAPLIVKNYYKPSFFWFELDQSQTRKLINLFLSSPAPGYAPRLENTSRLNNKVPFSCGAREAANNDEDGCHKTKYGGEKLDTQCRSKEASCTRTNENKKVDYVGSHASDVANLDVATQRTWSSLFHNLPVSKGEDGLEAVHNEQSHASILPDFNVATQRTWSSLSETSSAIDPLKKGEDEEMQALDVIVPRSEQSMMEWDSSADVLVAWEDENSAENESWEDRCVWGEEPCCKPSEFPMHNDVKDVKGHAGPTVAYSREYIEADNSHRFQEAEAISQEAKLQTTKNKVETSSSDFRTELVEKIEVLNVPQPSGSSILYIVNEAQAQEADTADLFQVAGVSYWETDLITIRNRVDTGSSDLQTVVSKLVEEVEVLKASQLLQNEKICSLEQELKESKLEIQQLRDKYGSCSSTGGGPSREVGAKL